MKVLIEPVRVDFKIPIGPGRSLDRFVYCYLIHGDGADLIDSGIRGTERTLLERIRSRGGPTSELRALIHTHSHPDHIGSSRALREATGCSVLIHDAEAEWLERPEVQFARRPVPGFFDLVGGGVKPDRLLRDGEVIDMGDARTMQVIHCPGHSPGHIALHYELLDALFCGDAVPVPGQIPVYDDAVQAYRSVLKLTELRGVKRIYSAWEAPTRGGDARERLKAGLEVIEKVHELVRTNLLTPEMSSEELCRRCILKLGLPPETANSLTARTFEAHRRALDDGYVRLS